jgi:alpha-mannosidase
MPQLPQILAGMGYRGAFFRTHMPYGGDGPARDADWVRWIGPDGSSIPAVPAYSGPEQFLGNEWLMTHYTPGIGWCKDPAKTWADIEAFCVEMRSRGVALPIISRCEDWYTRPKPELFRDIAAHPEEKTYWVTAEDYFDLLERSGIQPVDLTAWPNDFAPVQPWGYTGNRTWTGPRVASSHALTAEALAATAILSGFDWTAAHQKRLDDAWKNLLIAEHHDSLIVAIYNEGRDFTDPSVRLSQTLADEAAGYLASRTAARGPAVLVFNPTAHPRTECVKLQGGPWSKAVAPDGVAMPVQASPAGCFFLAVDVPALGYKVFRLESGAPAPAVMPAGRSLQTDRYFVEFGPAGGIVRLRDVRSGRELVPPGEPTGFLEGLIDNERRHSHGPVRLTAAEPCLWQAVETGHVGAVGYEMTCTFQAGSARIDLDIRLNIPAGTRIGRAGQFRESATKLRYVLATALGEGPRAVRHQPLVIQEAPAGAEVLDANLWASLESGAAGLAVANRGSMGYRVAGANIEPILAYSGEYVWGDKFLAGQYEYHYAIIPYGGPADRGAAHRHAIERDRPLFAFAFTGSGGDLPLEGAAIEVPKVDAAVTALALFPQDGRLFLRLCNMSSAPESVRLDRVAGVVDLALRTRAPACPCLHPWRAQTYEIER